MFFFFLPFRSKEEKMIDSQVVLQTTCFVPEWWRMDWKAQCQFPAFSASSLRSSIFILVQTIIVMLLMMLLCSQANQGIVKIHIRELLSRKQFWKGRSFFHDSVLYSRCVKMKETHSEGSPCAFMPRTFRCTRFEFTIVSVGLKY